MEFFTQYRYLIVPFAVWFGIQLFKVIWDLVVTHKFNFKRILGAGGMPSSHSAVVTSLATMIEKTQGITSPIFALSVVFACIVMYDAAGVRRAAGGKQYKVAEGDIIKVEKLGAEAGETVTFDQVLAVSNEGLKVGNDVAGATVTASVLGNGKAKKVIVYKYKRKTGYHKKNGHRQQFTAVKIEKINA